MTATHPGKDFAELDGGLLGNLSFEWIGDRYQHRWLFGQEQQPLIESLESDHSMHWPVSPPLQQVYHQAFEDGRDVMFGIGMAGRGHWSVSFTLVPELKSWIVELACRSSSEPPRLSSSYRLLGQWNSICENSEEPIAACVCPQWGLRIEPLSVMSRMELRDTELLIQPDQIPGGASTIQWGFRLRVT